MPSLNLNVAEIAALVGDPGRTSCADGLPRAFRQGIVVSSRSNTPDDKRAFGQAPLVSQMLESIMAIAGAQAPPPRLRPSRVEERVRTARTSASAQSLRGKLKLPAAGPVTGQRTETMIR